jgi:hypothetical protein
MTLNEAIEHLDETLGDSSRMWNCEECKQEHIQLREWLIELKGLREAQEPYKKGYWIYPLSIDCCCSECDNQPEHEPGESVPLYDYCPYCGAKMEVKWE